MELVIYDAFVFFSCNIAVEDFSLADNSFLDGIGLC